METKEYLQSELVKIEKWEKEQKGDWIWDRLTRLPFKLLDKITPKFIHEKIGILLDEIGSYIQNGGKYLTNEKSIFTMIEKKSGKTITGYDDIDELPLTLMEQLGIEVKEKWAKVATVQGATTGVGGIFTLALDIPALLGLSLKTLQEIAIIHGYDPNDQNERVFIIKCLQFTSADVVGKQAILKELSSYYQQSHRSQEMLSQLQGWREVVYTYRDQFGWKKFLQLIPIAGILFGAFTNRSMIHDLSGSANMLYRKRRILERIHNIE